MAVAFEVSIYIPDSDNDDQRFSYDIIDELSSRLIEVAGGLTVRRAANLGLWVGDDAHLYSDTNDEYTVALASLRDVPAILMVVDWAKEAFRQEAIYVRMTGPVAEVL